jgi:outer membrane assembly lipoprotein YfiO
MRLWFLGWEYMQFLFFLLLSVVSLLGGGCSTLPPSYFIDSEEHVGLDQSSAFSLPEDFFASFRSESAHTAPTNPSLDLLIAELTHPNWRVRLQAANGIDQHHFQSGRKALEILLNDRDIVTRLRADHILSNWELRPDKPEPGQIKEKQDVQHSNVLFTLLKKAEDSFRNDKFSEAISTYEEFLRKESNSTLGSHVQYKIAESFFRTATSVDRDPTPILQALKIYKKFLRAYPEHPYKKKAEHRIQQCQDWLALSNFLIGKFYYKREKYLAAAFRFQKALTYKPEFKFEREFLYSLARCYHQLGKEHWKDARAILIRLTQDDHQLPYHSEAKDLLALLPEETIPILVADQGVISFSQSHLTTDGEAKKINTIAAQRFPSSTNSPKDQKDCFSKIPNLPGSTAFSLNSSMVCDVSLIQKQIMVKLSHEQQHWNKGKLGGFDKVLTNFSKSSNELATSSGKLSAFGNLLKADFTIHHSQDVAQSKTLPNPLSDHTGNPGEFGADVRVSVKQNGLKYWSEYHHVDKEFAKEWMALFNDGDKDKSSRNGGKVGAGFNMGYITPQIEFGQFKDNVSDDPLQPQTQNTSSKMGLKFAVPQLPVLTLSYENGKGEKTDSSGESNINVDNRFDSLSATLWHGGTGWETFLTTSQFVSKDKTNDNYKTVLYDYIAGGRFQLFDNVSFSPNVEYIHTTNPTDEYWTKQISTNLGIDYSPSFGDMAISLSGDFSGYQDSSGYLDSQRRSFFLSIEKDLRKIFNLPHKNQKIVLKFDQTQYTDFVYTESNVSTYSAFLLFTISP